MRSLTDITPYINSLVLNFDHTMINDMAIYYINEFLD